MKEIGEFGKFVIWACIIFVIVVIVASFLITEKESYDGVITKKWIKDGALLPDNYYFEIDNVTVIKINSVDYNHYDVGDNYNYMSVDIIKRYEGG